MSKEKNDKKVRADKYEKKLALKGDFEEIIGLLAKGADDKIKAKNQNTNSNEWIVDKSVEEELQS